jgi:hypothetical protein
MLDTVAELESRAIAATAGFRDTKQLLAGMLNLAPTEAALASPTPASSPSAAR